MRTPSHPIRSTLITCLAIAAGLGCSAEYGDAPDGAPTGYPAQFAQNGQFPTLAGSDGARTQSVDDATLGPTASLEADADDANDPDGQPNLDPSNTDADDGLNNLVILVTSIPPPSQLTVAVSGPAGGAGGDFFLNVLIDLTLDGQWGGTGVNGEPEWVIQNFPVTVVPGQDIQVTPPPFAFSSGNRLPDFAWMRVALTQEQIPGTDWDGTGTFASGEIEDHRIELPRKNNANLPIPVIVCAPNPVIFPPPPANAVRFTCTITNFGGAGRVRYGFQRLSGGVRIITDPTVIARSPAPGTPIPIAAAGVVTLNLVGIRGALPSRFRVTASAIDPPAVITPEGVTAGFGDSETFVDFLGGEPGEYEDYVFPPPEEIGEDQLKFGDEAG